MSVYSVQYYREHIQVHRNRRYKYKYGITLRIYDKLLAKQDGVCACCAGASVGDYRNGHFHVDEHPVVHTPRGLLCGPCNRVYVGRYEKGMLDPWHPMTEKIEKYLDKHN